MTTASKTLAGTVVDLTPRHDGGYLLKVSTPEGLKVARSLRAYAAGAEVTLRGSSADYSVLE